MGIKSWNAGIIRPVPVPPAGPYQDGAAPGVWTLDQVAFWTQQGLWPIAGNAAPIGLMGGGLRYSPSTAAVNTIDRISLASTGNATSFGDLTVARRDLASCASNTRGIWAGGGTTYLESQYNVIDYVTIASAGNATDFGDLLSSTNGLAGASNYVRGLFAGGIVGGTTTNVIQYITIASAGNATDFGDLTGATQQLAGCASSTRATFAGGSGSSATIAYVTIASTGNAVSFGNLTVGRYFLAGLASSTRGVFGGGYNTDYSNVIDYITLASTGNAVDFGDLTVGTYAPGACASSTTGIFGGGEVLAGPINVIQSITIATTGNAVDFGDLTTSRELLAGCSSGAAAVQPTPTSSAMALFGGGYGTTYIAAIQYVNIATTGNSYLFGNLISATTDLAACASSTRGIFAGGSTNSDSRINVIQFTTFSSFAVATDFGDLTQAYNQLAGCSNSTRGLFTGGVVAGGNTNNTIEYITIASAGNATDFGDLAVYVTYPVYQGAMCASTTRGLYGGGYDSARTNVIQYVTIATTGNSTDFGDLTEAGITHPVPVLLALVDCGLAGTQQPQ